MNHRSTEHRIFDAIFFSSTKIHTFIFLHSKIYNDDCTLIKRITFPGDLKKLKSALQNNSVEQPSERLNLTEFFFI